MQEGNYVIIFSMIPEYFIVITSILSFFGALSYLRSTLKGTTKPNKVTWLLWAIAPLIAFSAEVNQGVGIASLLTFMVGFNPLLIFIASFINKKAYWKIEKFDILCGLFSVIGLLCWYFTKVGNIAIFFSIVTDALAGVPTIIKSYREPETENSNGYLYGGINAFVTLLAIKQWNFAHFGFPLYIVLINTLLVLLVKFKIGKTISNKL